MSTIAAAVATATIAASAVCPALIPTIAAAVATPDTAARAAWRSGLCFLGLGSALRDRRP